MSPAKAAIKSDRAIAEKLTGRWLPCQESSALHWPAPSKYRLKTEGRSTGRKLQNPSSDPRQYKSGQSVIEIGHQGLPTITADRKRIAATNSHDRGVPARDDATNDL
jgi:hypothetical protein